VLGRVVISTYQHAIAIPEPPPTHLPPPCASRKPQGALQCTVPGTAVLLPIGTGTCNQTPPTQAGQPSSTSILQGSLTDNLHRGEGSSLPANPPQRSSSDTLRPPPSCPPSCCSHRPRESFPARLV